MGLTRIPVDMIEDRSTGQKLSDKLTGMSKVPNEYTWTAANSQTDFTIPSGTISDTKLVLTLTLDGMRQDIGNSVQLINGNTFHFTEAVPDGVEVYVKWFEAAVPATVGHHTTHELGGQDAIDITKLKNFQEQVATPLADIAIDVKSPQFGAKGDGVTDDTAAIQAAVNFIANQSFGSASGGRVYFPMGTFFKTGLVTIPANVILCGSGDMSGIVSTTDGFSVTGSNVVFEKLNLQRADRSKVTKGTAGVYIQQNVTDVTFHNVTIDSFNTGICSNGYNDKIHVLGCEILNCNNTSVEGFDSDTGSGYGIIFQSSTNTLIDKCYFNNVYRHSIYISVLNVQDNVNENHKITNNTMIQSTAKGITQYEMVCKIMSAKNVLIEGNTIIGGTAALMITDGRTDHNNLGNPDLENIKVVNNTFKNTTGYTDNICGNIFISGNPYYVKKLVIQNNISVGGNCDFIYSNMGFQDVIIENNIYDLETTSANYLNGRFVRLYTPITLESMMITNNICRGYRIYFVNATIANAMNNCDNIQVIGNTVNSTGFSVWFNMSYLTHDITKLIIDRNTFVSDNTGNSLYFSNQSGYTTNLVNCKITNNRLQNSPSIGINGAFEFFNNDISYFENNANRLTFQNDNGKKITRGTAAPTAWTWAVGDICDNTSPADSGYLGWVCITAGTGANAVWEGFGYIGGSRTSSVTYDATIIANTQSNNIRKQSGTISIYLLGSFINTLTQNTSYTIGTVSAGFRPAVRAIISYTNATGVSMEFSVETNGNVVCTPKTASAASGSWIGLTLTYASA